MSGPGGCGGNCKPRPRHPGPARPAQAGVGATIREHELRVALWVRPRRVWGQPPGPALPAQRQRPAQAGVGATGRVMDRSFSEGWVSGPGGCGGNRVRQRGQSRAYRPAQAGVGATTLTTASPPQISVRPRRVWGQLEVLIVAVGASRPAQAGVGATTD